MTAVTERSYPYENVPDDLIREFGKRLNFVEKARFGLGADKRTYILMEKANLKEAREVAKFFLYLSENPGNANNSITKQEASGFTVLLNEGDMGPVGTAIYSLRERAIEQIAARSDSNPINFSSTSTLVNEMLKSGRQRAVTNERQRISQFYVEQQRLLRASGIYSHMI